MRKFYFLSTLALTILVCSSSFAQDFSNKGKDFWVAYGYHERMTAAGGNSQDMVLYFATDQVTNITINIPGTGYTQNLTSPAGNNVLTSVAIPKSGAQDARLQVDGLSNKGIHITSDKAIVAYAHIYNGSCSGATILFPTNTLGKEYYSINYKNISNFNNANCWFYVVAADTGTTTVEIIPSAATTGGWTAGSLHTVTLTQGQVYNVMGTFSNSPPANPANGVDLTGSKITSIASASGGCKKIAVYSGTGRISITCNNNSSSSDNYMVQAFPKTAWGKKYLTVPAAGNQSFNIYRVCVFDPTTIVKINGVVTALPLQGNFYYEIAATNQPQLIEADKPITVAQYFTSQGSCGNGNQPGDPEVIYLSPVEQNINKVLWNATPNFLITNHYFNVVIPNTGTAVSSFRLDGAVPAGAFVTHPQDPGYKYLRQSVSAGFHYIQSDSGFNSIAYGFGNAESYGYNGGTNIRDLFQFIQLINPYGTVPFPATCRGTPFNFAMVFPYRPIQIQWIFGPPLNAMGINDTTIYNGGLPITEDSSWVVAGRTLYRYKLPRTYYITAIGTYPIKVVATNPTPDGCGNEQTIDFDVQVFEPPIADFNFFTTGCSTSPVNFTDNSNTGGRPIISRYWDFGDASNSFLAAPSHLYAAQGTYNVKYTLITDVGCLADTVIHPVTLNVPPLANFTVSAPDCNGGTISFTDISTATGGAIINQWAWNFGDPASGPLNTSTLQNPTHIFSGPGTYTVTLQVQTTTGCASLVDSFLVTIHANPVANFSLPNVCLPGGAAQFNDLSTIAAGESITGWDWDFGDASPHSFVQNPLHIYAGVGPYTVTLIVTSSNGCTHTKVQILTTIYAEPQAAFTNPPEVCLGNSVTFTDMSTAPGSTVTGWDWDFGDGTPHSNAQNPTHTYTAAGTYTVILNVTSAIGCQTVNNFASHQVLVRPLPTATINGTISVCQNAPMPNITFTGANGIPPYIFTYQINGVTQPTINSGAVNSVTVAAPTGIVGTFIYTLLSVQEGSGVACNQPQTGSATVTVSQLPTATISGTIAVCQNAPQPNITFTGANGTAPYTFTYNINGGPNQVVTTVAGNSVTVAVPTGVVGTFTYTLLNVLEGGPLGCSQSQTGSQTVTVNALPTATISGTTEVCLNAPQPNITFTGAGTTAPYTFTYNINGGPNQVVTTVAGNSVTVAVPTNVAGTFVYNLVSVQDASPTTCSQNQSGSATVIVRPLPTAIFTLTSPTCETRTICFTDLSVANAGSIVSWGWDFDDGSTSTLQNPCHTFATAGTYNVTLVVTTNFGCVSINPAQQVVINPKPLAGYIIPEVCLSDTYAQFTDTSKVAVPDNIVAWAWNFGDPPSGPLNTSTLQNPQHSYSATGPYNVQLIVTSNRGCKDTIMQVLFVNGSFPVADFTVVNPATLCANDSVSILEASTVFPGVITKVEMWFDDVAAGPPGLPDILDNFPVTGKVYKHLYPNFQAPLTKVFRIRYRAYSGGVCLNEKLRNITVNAAPKVQFNAMPNICYDAAPYQITPAIAREIGNVPGNGIFTGPGVSLTGLFSPAVAGPGTHRILYTFTSTAGGCIDTASNTITVWDTASAKIDVQPVACERNTVSFTSTNSTIPPGNGSITGWTWNFGDPASGLANTSTSATPSHLFTGWGNYNVTLFVSTSNGCRSTIRTKTVFVNPQPKPNFSTPASSCLPNASVSFSNLSTIADGTQPTLSYFWNFGDPGSGNNTSPQTNPSHIYTGTGPFNVNLQVTSAAGCVHDTTINLTTVHPQPLASFTVDKIDVCIGGSFDFNNTTDPLDGTITQYNWTMDDGNGQSVPTFTYTYGAVRSYDVSLFIFNSNGCRSTTATKTVFVNPYPPADAGPDKFMLEGGQVTLTPALNATMPVTYLWTPNFHLSDPTIAYTIASPPFDYTYTLTVTTDKGCARSDDVFIKVLKAPAIPNIFSPNGDGIHDTWVIQYLESYPGCTVDIFNRYGQQIYHSEGYTKPWDGTINGNPVPIGTYYYIVNPKNGRKIMSGYVDVIR